MVPPFPLLTTERDWNWGFGNHIASNAVIPSIINLKTEWKLYPWHWRLWQATQGRLIAYTTKRINKARVILVAIVTYGGTSLRHIRLGMSACCIGCPTAETHPKKPQLTIETDCDAPNGFWIWKTRQWSWGAGLRTFKAWAWSHTPGWGRTSGSTPTIPLVDDRNALVFIWGWFTIINNEQSSTIRRKDYGQNILA